MHLEYTDQPTMIQKLIWHKQNHFAWNNEYLGTYDEIDVVNCECANQKEINMVSWGTGSKFWKPRKAWVIRSG